ncbi:Uncharacterised protein [Mycobacteroides abscessus subsp. abscessus]|nr:Uncharacterised protein [Mycobacteroides abscessus subsp. abscessus]
MRGLITWIFLPPNSVISAPPAAITFLVQFVLP